MSYCEEQLADIFGLTDIPRSHPPPDYYANVAECHYRRNEDAEAVRVLPTLLQFEITAKERLHSVIGSPEEVAAQSLTYAAVFMHIATSAEQIGDADSARTAIRKSYALLVEAQMQDQEAADIARAYQKIAGGEG
jgi:hypothetical protein